MNLKNTRLNIIIIAFFLIINTSYYWEGKLDFFAFPVFIVLGIVYLVLVIALIRQIYFLVKEKFRSKNRFITTGILIIVLPVTYFKPSGIIDFDKLSGNDVLIAQREGGGNCQTIVKLKDNYTFREINVCFGVSEIKGKYYLKNDTIFFDNETNLVTENKFYEFAVVRTDKSYQELFLYTSRKDTVGLWLPITKNELGKLKNK